MRLSGNQSKRIAAIAAVGTLAAIGLTACGGASSGNESKTLSIGWEQAQKPGMEAVVKKFEEANPGVTVKTSYSSGANLFSGTRTQLAAGTAPDILLTYPGSGLALGAGILDKAGYLADLSDQPWVKSIPKSLLPNDKSSDGKRVISFQGVVTGYQPVYNDQALAETGLKPPTKWSDVIPFCKAARAAGKVAYAQGIVEPALGWFVPSAWSAEAVFGSNPDFVKYMANGGSIANTGWKEMLDKQVEMTKDGCFNDDFAGVDNVAVQKMVAKGDALGTFTHGGEILYMLPFNPKATFSITAFPMDDDPSNDRMTVFQYFGLGVNAHGNVALAKKFVQFFATPEMNTLYVNSQTDSTQKGVMPVLVDKATWKGDQFSNYWSKYIDSGKIDPAPEDYFPNPDVIGALASGLQDALVGRKTVDSVLSDMQKAYKSGS